MNPEGQDSYIVLCSLCVYLEKGMTLDKLSQSINRSLSSVHLYLGILKKAGIEYKYIGRGTRDDPRKVCLITPSEKSRILLSVFFKKRQSKREKYLKSRRKEKKCGMGIESWLFLTPERAAGYKNWCESWTKD